MWAHSTGTKQAAVDGLTQAVEVARTLNEYTHDTRTVPLVAGVDWSAVYDLIWRVRDTPASDRSGRLRIGSRATRITGEVREAMLADELC